MAIDSIAASTVANFQANPALAALRVQFHNKSGTVNIVRDAVKDVEETNAAVDRRRQDRLVDILV